MLNALISWWPLWSAQMWLQWMSHTKQRRTRKKKREARMCLLQWSRNGLASLSRRACGGWSALLRADNQHEHQVAHNFICYWVKTNSSLSPPLHAVPNWNLDQEESPFQTGEPKRHCREGEMRLEGHGQSQAGEDPVATMNKKKKEGEI